ncbi:MAG TPA: hypothetical protein VKC51_11500 [Lacunisphaera sp.]|nr:hypothetical protein [Lacunisphaera sp.]
MDGEPRPEREAAEGGHGREITWREFSKKFRDELFAPAATDAGNATIKNHGQKFTLRLLGKLAAKGNITLLCHCAEDAKECHRFLLQKLIERERE